MSAVRSVAGSHPSRLARAARLVPALLVASLVLAGLIAAAPAGAAPTTSLNVGYFTGLIAEPETVIGSTPSLAATVPAALHWVPITAGVTALAEMAAGGLDVVAGVGNPPTVASIANGVPLDVVWAQSLDSDSLVVHSNVKSPQALAGKTVGDLEGSSEDYEVRGWLSTNHLTSSVQVIGFESEQAIAAAWLAGKIDAGYVTGTPELTLVAHGGHPLTNAKKIAAIGYPGLNVLAVSDSLVKNDPSLVQKYVCAEAAATNDLFSKKQNSYFKRSAALLGVAANQAVAATKEYLAYYITPAQEKHWLVGANGTALTSPTVVAYTRTADFDLAQGRITSVPSPATLASHVIARFALYAAAGHCS
jgi:taurine transport system substrate-binding protein